MSIVIKHEQEQRRYVLAQGDFKELTQYVLNAVEKEGAELLNFRLCNDGIFYMAEINFPIRKI